MKRNIHIIWHKNHNDLTSLHRQRRESEIIFKRWSRTGFHLTCSLTSLGEHDTFEKMKLLNLAAKLDVVASLRLKRVKISYRTNQVTLGERIREKR